MNEPPMDFHFVTRHLRDVGGEYQLKQRIKRLEGLLGDLIGVIKPNVSPTELEAQAKLEEIASLLKGNERDMHYVMGRADPVASRTPQAEGTPKSVTYFSPGGMDITAYMCLGGQITPMGRLQGISWKFDKSAATPHAPILGNMISLVMGSTNDKMCTLFHRAPTTLDFIMLQAMDEYGYAAWLALAKVHVYGRYGGASIDDICLDDGWNFSAQEMIGWNVDHGVHAVAKDGAKSGRIDHYQMSEEAAKELEKFQTS